MMVNSIMMMISLVNKTCRLVGENVGKDEKGSDLKESFKMKDNHLYLGRDLTRKRLTWILTSGSTTSRTRNSFCE